jgi:WD40 repeat protein
MVVSKKTQLLYPINARAISTQVILVRCTLVLCTLCLASCSLWQLVEPNGDDSVRVNNQSANDQAAHALGRDIESHASRDPVRRRIVPDVNSSDPEIKQSIGAAETDILPATGQPIALPKLSSLKHASGHNAEIVGLFSASTTNSSQMVSVDSLGAVLLWDMKSGQAGELLNLGFSLEAVAYLPSKGLLALAHDGGVSIYSLVKREETNHLKRGEALITCLDFQPSGESLLIGAADGRVYRWKFAQDPEALDTPDAQKLFERYSGPPTVVSAVAYHPYGRIFFSGDWDGGLNTWLSYDADKFGGQYDKNLFGAKLFQQKSVRTNAGRGDAQRIEQILVSSDGEQELASMHDGTVELWQVRGFSKIGSVKAHGGLVHHIAALPKFEKIASAGRDGSVKIWELVQSAPTIDKPVAYEFHLIRTYAVRLVRRIVFRDKNTLIAGLSNGAVLQIDLTKEEQPQ